MYMYICMDDGLSNCNNDDIPSDFKLMMSCTEVDEDEPNITSIQEDEMVRWLVMILLDTVRDPDII